MSIDLMAKRYKVIADYPLNISKVGFVFDNCTAFQCAFFNKYPHLFKELHWYEEREIEDLEPEMWADIGGYEGLYQISSYGRVKSLIRSTERMHKGVTKYSFMRKEKFLKLQKKPDDYVKVELSKNGITKVLYPHRLVAIAFVPNPENKPNVNHIYNIRDFNFYKGLEWSTQSENLLHSVRTNDYCGQIKNRKRLEQYLNKKA